MMRNLLQPLCLFLLLAVAAPVTANTRFGFGTIVAVDADGSGNKKNTPGFTVCYEWFNLNPTAVLKHTFYPFEERTRHGWRVYFLDGKPSTAAEALAVGRAICVSDNEMVCWVSTGPGPQADVGAGTAADGWLMVPLKGAFATKAAKVNKGQAGEMEALTSEVLLLVDIRGGAIAGAAALMPSLSSSDYAVDHARLTWSDGRLGGAFSFTAMFPAGGSYRLETGDVVAVTGTVDAAVGEDGAVTGNFTGTCDGREVAGTIAGKRYGCKPRLESCRLWLQFWDMHHTKFYYAIVPVVGGQGQGGGDFLYSKGHVVGGVPLADLTIDSNRVTGAIEIDGEKPIKVTVDAVVIGDRLVFGTWTATEGDAAGTYSLRGGIVPGVDAGPQIRGSDMEQQAMVKELQTKLHPEAAKE